MRGSDLRELVRGGKRSRSYCFGGTYATESKFLVRDGVKYITEAAIPFDNILLEHLRPSTPECISAYVQGVATRHDDGAGGEYVTNYSYVADPLGLLDSIRFHSQLYDRGADPKELSNLAASRWSDADAMQGAVATLTAESMRVHSQLAEGDSARELTVNEARALRALGYAIGSEPARDTLVDEKVKRLHQEPRRVLPDMTTLVEVDRRLHRMRLALREGRKPDLESGRDELKASAAEAVAWLKAQPTRDCLTRCGWRIREAGELARVLGVEIDEVKYLAAVGMGPPPRGPAPDGR
jgi:hypothetical protein